MSGRAQTLFTLQKAQTRQAEVVAAIGKLNSDEMRAFLQFGEQREISAVIRLIRLCGFSRNPVAIDPLRERLNTLEESLWKRHKETFWRRREEIFEARLGRLLVPYNRRLDADSQQAHRTLYLQMAIFAFGEVAGQDALPTISPFLNDYQESVRVSAGKAVARLSTA